MHLLFLSKGKGHVMLSTLDLKSTYEEQGYAVARQLFTPDEVALLREHYMRLRAQGPHRGDLVGVDTTSEDPLKRYPRMIQMHHWDEVSLRWLLSMWFPVSLPFFSPYSAGNRLDSARGPPSLLAQPEGHML